MPKPKASPSKGVVDRFARHLEQSERSRLTVKSYRCDLKAFAVWFERTNGNAMEPDKITPTDLRQFKQWLLNDQRLKACREVLDMRVNLLCMKEALA